jgi:hypothetical protein
MAFYDFRKLKQPIRVRGSVKFCQRYTRQLLVSGRYNFMNLIYIREKGSRFCIYCKKDRHSYIFIEFS